MRKITKEIFGEYPKTEDELISSLGRKWKVSLVDLKKLAYNLRYCPIRRIRVVNLGMCSEFMLSSFEYPMKCSRIIKIAMKIGMLALVDMTTLWGIYEHRSRRFAVNRKVVDLVLKVPVETNVLINVVNNTTTTTTTNNIDKYKEINEINNSTDIKDPSKLLEISINSERKDMKLAHLPDNILLAALMQCYPQIEHYMLISNKVNEFYGEDSLFKLRVIPHIERNGKRVNFRLRASSPFCSIVKSSKRKSECDLCREDILEEKFGIYTRYDVKSSIYRVTWMLNHEGLWPEEDIDFYCEIYGKKFRREVARNNFKELCQRVYFNSNDNKCLNSLLVAVKEGKLALPEEYDNQKILEMIADTRECMYNAIGKGYGSEIFVHEEFIYMDVLHKLLAMGYQAVEIYDCFYVKGECPELPSICRDLIVASAKEYYERYIK